MTGFELLGLFIAGLALVFLFLKPERSRVAVISRHDDYSVATGNQGEVVMLRVPSRHGDAQAYEMVSRRFLPCHTFALGVLSGFGIMMVGAKLFYGSAGASNNALWFLLWLAVIACTWLAVYVAERVHIFRLLKKGTFERLISGGSDPVTVAAAVCYCSRRFTTWNILAAFLGGAALSATDVRGYVISAIMLLAAGLFYWQSRSEGVEWVSPRELGKRLVSARDHLADGGWVMPAGLLLFVASFGLLFFWQTGMAMLMYVALAGVGLVLWSERVSRAAANVHTLQELRSQLRTSFQQPAESGTIFSTLF